MRNWVVRGGRRSSCQWSRHHCCVQRKHGPRSLCMAAPCMLLPLVPLVRPPLLLLPPPLRVQAPSTASLPGHALYRHGITGVLPSLRHQTTYLPALHPHLSPVGSRFTSAFEVSNKATELLMQRSGVTCSCGDPGAIARYEAALAAEPQP